MPILVSNEGAHKVLFSFDSSKDVDRILSGEPWSFDKSLVVLQRYNRLTPLEDLAFDKASFWVQVHNIPIGYRTKSVAEDICESIGAVDRSTEALKCEGGNYTGPSKKNVVRVSGFYKDRAENISTWRGREGKQFPSQAKTSKTTKQPEKDSSDMEADFAEFPNTESCDVMSQHEENQCLQQPHNLIHTPHESHGTPLHEISNTPQRPVLIDATLQAKWKRYPRVAESTPVTKDDIPTTKDNTIGSKRSITVLTNQCAMSCIVWNCRGLGNQLAIQELVELVQVKAPAVVFLAETLANEARLDYVKERIWFDHKFFVPRITRGGRLVFYWRSDIEVENSLPWLCVGDFNEVTKQSEKSGGRLRPRAQMQLFREVLDECSFMDLCFKAGLEFQQKKKAFQFKEMWLADKECGETVEGVWQASYEEGDNRRVLRKIENCGKGLTRGSQKCFRNVRKELEKKRKELARVEKLALQTGGSFWLVQIQNEINVLMGKEERTWRQRSRTLYLKDGDRTTRFFHCRATQRKRRNHIAGIQNQADDWCTEQNQISDIFLDYYNQLFTSSNPIEMAVEIDSIPKVVTEEMNGILTQDNQNKTEITIK
uniref:Endonuclease/exonuclease/phosphatase domain-containing protein n=1 Tax=Quercus lobata TaxID=97700 RepID=A0A7N2LQP6_QUELO